MNRSAIAGRKMAYPSESRVTSRSPNGSSAATYSGLGGSAMSSKPTLDVTIDRFETMTSAGNRTSDPGHPRKPRSAEFRGRPSGRRTMSVTTSVAATLIAVWLSQIGAQIHSERPGCRARISVAISKAGEARSAMPARSNSSPMRCPGRLAVRNAPQTAVAGNATNAQTTPLTVTGPLLNSHSDRSQIGRRRDREQRPDREAPHPPIVVRCSRSVHGVSRSRKPAKY